MGEGTFVSLLSFLERHAPDPLTRRIAHLTRNDEARHVAFSLAHLERHAELEPDLRSRLARAVERRHRALQSTAGLNDDVFDALVLLAAGDDTARAHRRRLAARAGPAARDGRRPRTARLARLGFTPGEAETAVVAAHPQLHVSGAGPVPCRSQATVATGSSSAHVGSAGRVTRRARTRMANAATST